MSSTSMKFVTPSQYTKSNLAHFIINTRAVNDFIKVHPSLAVKDNVLDFGCGTGETTAAIAQGKLGDLGNPGKVMGVDISEDMITHSSSTHTLSNLSFQQLDVNQGDSFISSNKSTFSLVTSFSCLHWVPDVPAAVNLFNNVLSLGGKFLFVTASTHNIETNPQRKVFEQMKREAKWADIMKETSWMHFKTVHQNSGWMSDVNKNGQGYIQERDFAGLLEKHGFRVDDAKTVPLKYKFQEDFIKNYFKSIVLTSFPEIQGENRKQFFNEYIPRVKELTQKDADGYYDSNVDGVQIFGEKISNV